MQRRRFRTYLFRIIAAGTLVGVGPTAASSCLFVECHDSDDCDYLEFCNEDGRCETGSDDSVTTSTTSGSTCADTSEDCEFDACCDSNDVCVDFTQLGYQHCAARCSSDSGCQSNCCRALQSGTLVCHSSSHPNCN